MAELINSSAIILKPNQVFYDWLTSDNVKARLPDEAQKNIQDLQLAVIRANATVMVVPFLGVEPEENSAKYIREHADRILEAEFARWQLDAALKPNEKAVELLRRWFDISYHTRIYYFKSE